MRLGVVLPQTEIGPDPRDLVRFAKTAEDNGFDYLTVYDHILGADTSSRPDWDLPYDLGDQFHEILVLLGFLAGLTSLELVPGVVVLPLRQAVLVAKQAAELDILTGGRFRMGVGTGWNQVESEALGMNFSDRGARFEEQIEVMRRLWTDDSVTYEGRFHRIDRAGILPRPVQQPIPLWLGGGTSSRVLERIGRLADGWITNLSPGPELTAARAAIADAATAAGRDPASVGLQGRLEPGDVDPARLRDAAAAWEAEGADYLSVSGMNAGLSPSDHVAFVEKAAVTLR